MHWIVLSIILIFARPAMAQELSLMGGMADNLNSGHNSTSWQMEYRHDLVENLAVGFTYVNEGHVPNHHRDGSGLQFWGQTRFLDHHVGLAAGVGPYFYFDTTIQYPGGPSRNEHGWAGIASLAGSYYTDSRWLFQVRTNWVGIGSRLDNLSAVAGIGYQLDDPKAKGQEEPADFGQTKNEITAFIGQTITNTFNTSQDVATSVEYRRSLTQYIQWTVAYLYEVDNRLIRRNGITSQIWLAKPFLKDRFSVAAGAGAYYALEHYSGLFNGRREDEVFSGIATFSANYNFHPNWGVRVSWNRVITKYNLDTDVLLAGIGFRF